MPDVTLILIVAALVLFVIDGFKIFEHPRLQLTALGLACWVGASVYGALA
jgi:hypothetical protein